MRGWRDKGALACRHAIWHVRAHMLNSEIQDDRLNCALSTLGQPSAECSLSHILITAKSNFHIFWAGKRHRHNDSWHTHTDTHWDTQRHMRGAYKAWRYAYPFHMLRLPGKDSTGQLSWFRHWECDWECDWEWKVARVARPLAPYIIISAPKRLIWVWRTFRFRFDCSKVRNDRPSVLLRMPVQWVVHGIINCKRTPVCLYNGGNCAATATATASGVEPQPRHRSSLVDASPMGFSFTASAKGVCQCRGESSQNQSQSRVEVLCAGLHWNWMPFVFN